MAVATTIALSPLVALTACQSAPKATTPESLTEQNKPGIVLVQANHKVAFSYPTPVFDEKFLQEGGVTPKTSAVSQEYQRAIELFQNKHFKKALEQFKQIRDSNPNFPYIQQKISQTIAELPNEPFSVPEWAYVAGAVLLFCGAGTYSVKRYLAHTTSDQVAVSPVTIFRQRFQSPAISTVAPGSTHDRANNGENN